ncbi:DUF6848 family protein [Desulforegula conservatrix]|uniref:DUF6848 family protein n=1 Tax=Desulforegula conservatrix TaxID=153026 RepID=UPI0004028ECF|nr:hypothetical protein [Desulforegula conservatrix]
MPDENTSGYKEFKHSFNDPFADIEIEKAFRFTRPKTPSVDRCQKQMMKSPAKALEGLCLDAVHPDDKAQIQEDFKVYPGLASAFGNELLKAVGFGDLGN